MFEITMLLFWKSPRLDETEYCSRFRNVTWQFQNHIFTSVLDMGNNERLSKSWNREERCTLKPSKTKTFAHPKFLKPPFPRAKTGVKQLSLTTNYLFNGSTLHWLKRGRWHAKYCWRVDWQYLPTPTLSGKIQRCTSTQCTTESVRHRDSGRWKFCRRPRLSCRITSNGVVHSLLLKNSFHNWFSFQGYVIP